MSSQTEERLYNLLPAIYRIRDSEQGEPLRALFGILQEQFSLLETDIGGLYDDWFIETCEEWVVPYIADLLGARLLYNIESNSVYSQRALVANTLSYRRRKGTLLMLEDLARDVTGWGAHAVEFFQLLGWTQHLNHLRFEHAPNPNLRNPSVLNPNSVNRVGSVNLRSLDTVDRINTAFDQISHSVDVRKPNQNNGWHNIRNLGFFLWRLQSYPIIGAQPQVSTDYADGYYFSPLGNPIVLFNNPERRDRTSEFSTETNVPGPIRPIAFFQNPGDYYGYESDKSIAIYRGDTVDPAELIPIEDIMCKDLSDWSEPPTGKVAIDVRLGRFAFASGETPEEGITVTYHYGFSADIGSGPYDRRQSIEKTTNDDWIVIVARQQPDPMPTEWRTTVADAVNDWNPNTHSRAVIIINDNSTYDESFSLNLEDNQHLIIQADNHNRPLLRFHDEFAEPTTLNISGGNGENATLSLNGLLVEGAVHVDANSLGKLEIVHTTLVPGRAVDEQGLPFFPDAASINVEPDNNELEVLIDSSIVGPMRLPEEMKELLARDSIIDSPDRGEAGAPALRIAVAQSSFGNEPGPVTTLERTTVFGSVLVKTMQLASNVIFTRTLSVNRRQEGCIRYSFVDDLVSVTPRRFRCQPDLSIENRKKQLSIETLPPADEALIRSRMQPDFTSVRYGRAGYAQLSSVSAQQIKTGAQSGAEMGVFEHLKQPQRESNLKIRLQEYMPYGLEAGTIYVT